MAALDEAAADDVAIEQAVALLESRGFAVKRPRSIPPDLVVILPGPPRGWGRTGATVITPKTPGKKPFVSLYTDKETRSYEAMLRFAAEQAMRGRPLFGGALRIRINALFAVPDSYSGKRRRDCLAGIERPTKAPDFDNIAKMVDAFKGVAWKDDVQIVDGRVVKAYALKPAFEMELYALRLSPQTLL